MPTYRRNHYKSCTIVGKVVSHGATAWQFCNSTHVLGLNKEVCGWRMGEARFFPCWEWKVTDKQLGKAKVNPVENRVLVEVWHINMNCLALAIDGYIQREIISDVCIHGLRYIHLFPSWACWEDLDTMTLSSNKHKGLSAGQEVGQKGRWRSWVERAFYTEVWHEPLPSDVGQRRLQETP